MQPPQDSARSGSFISTPWSLLLGMHGDYELTESDKEFAQLCSIYRRPITSFIKAHGFGDHAALDIALRFICSLIDRNHLDEPRSPRYPFRAYVRAQLKSFLADEERAEWG